jgi:hypothetical protein
VQATAGENHAAALREQSQRKYRRDADQSEDVFHSWLKHKRESVP